MQDGASDMLRCLLKYQEMVETGPKKTQIFWLILRVFLFTLSTPYELHLKILPNERLY